MDDVVNCSNSLFKILQSGSKAIVNSSGDRASPWSIPFSILILAIVLFFMHRSMFWSLSILSIDDVIDGWTFIFCRHLRRYSWFTESKAFFTSIHDVFRLFSFVSLMYLFISACSLAPKQRFFAPSWLLEMVLLASQVSYSNSAFTLLIIFKMFGMHVIGLS